MKMTKHSHLIIRFQNILFYVLLLGIIGMLAWLGKTYHKSLDLTQGQRNTLSVSTQQLLGRLDKPLKLIAYVPDDATVHVALKKLVNKYQLYKKDISLEFVNPDLEPERAKADGIQYSGQVVIKLDDKSETVNSVAEQTVLNVLQRLSRDKPRLAVFLEGHDERSPLETKSSGMSQLAEVLESKGFRFQPHNLIRTQNIPEDATFVVIASPQKDYLPGEVKIIKDYINRGGNLLWLHEPGPLHGLEDIEQQLGLEIQEGTLVDANQDLQQLLGIKHPAVIAVIDYGDSEITENLSAHTIFPLATAIMRDALVAENMAENSADSGANDKDENDKAIKTNWNYQPFLSTLVTSWLESGKIQGNVKFDAESDKPGPLDIGMALTRLVPSQALSTNSSETAVHQNNSGAVEQDKEQRVVVVGDSDFMLNNFIGQGSNLELSTNIFNWLSKDDELLSISTASSNDARLEMPGWALYGSAILFLLVLPIGLFGIGMIRWLRRRKR